MPSGIVADCPQKVDLTQVWSEGLDEVELTVCALPEQEVAQALLPRCADDQVGIGLTPRVKVLADRLGRQALGQLLERGMTLGANQVGDPVLDHSQRAQLEANNLELKKEAEAVATKLAGKSFVAIRSAGDTGQLYGSVSTRDIAEAVTEGGFTVDRRQVIMDKPIKTLGVHASRVMLHPEVIVDITLNVARTAEEAERQARGEDVTVVKDEALDLETFNPDEMFEEGASPVAPGMGEQPEV